MLCACAALAAHASSTGSQCMYPSTPKPTGACEPRRNIERGKDTHRKYIHLRNRAKGRKTQTSINKLHEPGGPEACSYIVVFSCVRRVLKKSPHRSTRLGYALLWMNACTLPLIRWSRDTPTQCGQPLRSECEGASTPAHCTKNYQPLGSNRKGATINS
jgi:hypothetical protein